MSKVLDVHGRELPEPFDCPICFRPAEWRISHDGNLVRCPEGKCHFHFDGMRVGYFFDHWQRLGARAHERKLTMLKLIALMEGMAAASEAALQTALGVARLARSHVGENHVIHR
jgi:hypothetical protein